MNESFALNPTVQQLGLILLIAVVFAIMLALTLLLISPPLVSPLTPYFYGPSESPRQVLGFLTAGDEQGRDSSETTDRARAGGSSGASATGQEAFSGKRMLVSTVIE